MRYLIPAVLLLLVLSTPAVQAQQQAGDTELQINAFYYASVGTDFDFHSGTITGKIAQFITDAIEFGVFPSITFTTVAGETETTIGGGLFATYSLLASPTTVPYFGGQYYISDLDEASDTAAAGFTGGAKFFVTEKAFFDASGNYLFSLADEAEGGIFLLSAGFGYLF